MIDRPPQLDARVLTNTGCITAPVRSGIDLVPGEGRVRVRRMLVTINSGPQHDVNVALYLPLWEFQIIHFRKLNLTI